MGSIRKMKEETCKQCNLCCCYYVKILGKEIILPNYKCKNVDLNGLCSIYNNRPCVRGETMLTKRIAPNVCAYASKEYQGREVANPVMEKMIYNALPQETKQMLQEGFAP